MLSKAFRIPFEALTSKHEIEKSLKVRSRSKVEEELWQRLSNHEAENTWKFAIRKVRKKLEIEEMERHV